VDERGGQHLGRGQFDTETLRQFVEGRYGELYGELP